MNPPKCDELDYIHFLVAAQRVFSNVEAAKSHPAADAGGPAHDAYTRLLYRCRSDGEALWHEVEGCVTRDSGMIILDDSTLDKFYAKGMALVTRHWSGKHHRVVQGINLISLVWTEGEAHWPCDFRLYNTADGLTKNDHFRAMLLTAAARGFQPALVAFDSWYASLKNLKAVRDLGWVWLTQLKRNRLVDPDGTGNRPVSEVCIPVQGVVVHLKGYGFILVFKTVSPDGDVAYWATNDLKMTLAQCAQRALTVGRIEAYHRGQLWCMKQLLCMSSQTQNGAAEVSLGVCPRQPGNPDHAGRYDTTFGTGAATIAPWYAAARLPCGLTRRSCSIGAIKAHSSEVRNSATVTWRSSAC